MSNSLFWVNIFLQNTPKFTDHSSFVNVLIDLLFICRWLFVITMAVLYNYFLIIVRETFDELNESVLPLWLFLDYAADIIYFADMFIQLFTSKLDVVMHISCTVNICGGRSVCDNL